MPTKKKTQSEEQPIDPPTMVSSSPNLVRRIVPITADKGGTGKSTFARVYAHFLIEKGINTLAYDADTRNAQLARHYGSAFPLGVHEINLNINSDVNSFLDTLEKDYQVIMLDLPAGIGELIEVLENKLKLSKVAAENEYRLTFVSVLNRGRDCLNSLRSLIDAFGDRADHVVVKNLHYGAPEKFKRFDNSKTKNILTEMDARIITLPDLDDDVVDFIDDQSLTYKNAATKGIGSVSTRTWVNSFLSEAEPQIEIASSYLGF